MLTPQMSIQFQIPAVAPMGSIKGKGKENTTATMHTLVVSRWLWLDRDHIQGFISNHICALIWLCNVCGIKNEREWDIY